MRELWFPLSRRQLWEVMSSVLEKTPATLLHLQCQPLLWSFPSVRQVLQKSSNLFLMNINFIVIWIHLVIFVAGKFLYRETKPNGNVVVKVVNCISVRLIAKFIQFRNNRFLKLVLLNSMQFQGNGRRRQTEPIGWTMRMIRTSRVLSKTLRLFYAF